MKGIIFKPDMIKAIVEGRKTITRRLEGLREINHEPDIWVYRYFENGYSVFEGIGLEIWARAKPRYQVGEVVYVKEAWRVGAYTYRKDASIVYKLDNHIKLVDWNDWLEKNTKYGGSNVGDGDKWRSPMFMPARATRYFIKITGVRAERLQAISGEDAIAEGIFVPYQSAYESLTTDYRSPTECVKSYQVLWDSINKLPYNWQSNPWCFVYSFKLVDKER